MDNIRNPPDGQEQEKNKLSNITDEIQQVFHNHELTSSEIQTILSLMAAELNHKRYFSANINFSILYAVCLEIRNDVVQLKNEVEQLNHSYKNKEELGDSINKIIDVSNEKIYDIVQSLLTKSCLRSSSV